MQSFFIHGPQEVYGSIEVGTSKNATLPILAGSILAKDRVVIENIPAFSDIDMMVRILKGFGLKIFKRKNNLYIHTYHKNSTIAEEKYTKQIRSSIFLLGPMLAKWKEATIAYPGGCNIGARPIDIHLEGLRALGATIDEKDGYLICKGDLMHHGELTLKFPSVGATENLMMASVFLEGTTILHNVAKEPEIVDLANFINQMGGKVIGAGTDTIYITGVKELKGITYRPIPDRIVTGTLLLACATLGGKITLHHCIPEHNESLIAKLIESGCHVKTENDIIEIESTKKRKNVASIVTGVYPAFPTDLQSIYMVFASTGKGKCQITETIFENRFGIAKYLNAMGAKISTNGNTAFVQGVKKLKGTQVVATDLRAGAGLVIAGLKAEGDTTVQHIHHIDRGYEKIEDIFRMISVGITRQS